MQRTPVHTLELLNRWQHGFPLLPAPFAAIASAAGLSEAQVLDTYRDAARSGALSRIGGVWAAGAGGAALLCALAVPADRLLQVAAMVDALPGVNHNYEREHHHNLWFVITGRDRQALHRQLDQLESDTGLSALRLPMVRVYRIDLGFDLHGAAAVDGPAAHSAAISSTMTPAVAPADAALAALVEDGLPLEPAPFAHWARQRGSTEAAVLATLRGWLEQGSLRRFGVIVRHHELGYDQNAMTVFDVPDAEVDACGALLARQPGVTLCYQRERAPGWPYNLYCMVHGRQAEAVRGLVAAAQQASGLGRYPHAMLFSRRRFKQQGASYFRAAHRQARPAQEAAHDSA
ncbi:MAG: Lrp/AsnC family transcriptional regulator [Rubrivivax sp.]|nr:Lrp/AsnC family transcriptional regulator [Rubrivivax sp.]